MNDKIRLDLTREELEALQYALDNATQLARRAYLDNADWELQPTMKAERAKLLEHERKFKSLLDIVSNHLAGSRPLWQVRANGEAEFRTIFYPDAGKGVV